VLGYGACIAACCTYAYARIFYIQPILIERKKEKIAERDAEIARLEAELKASTAVPSPNSDKEPPKQKQ
jgi:hypothetical protein